MKGDYQDECYRTACSNKPAEYYNHSTRQHYCASCAGEINYHNQADAHRLYNHDLCTLVNPIPQESVEGLKSKEEILDCVVRDWAAEITRADCLEAMESYASQFKSPASQSLGMEEAAEKRASLYAENLEGGMYKPGTTEYQNAKHDFKEGFKAGAAHTGEGDAVAVLNWLLEQSGRRDDLNITMVDGQFFWITDYEGDAPISVEEIVKLFKQSKAIKP